MSTKVMTRQNEKNRNKIRTMAQIGMLSAIATVLMLFEIPLPFAPSFYEMSCIKKDLKIIVIIF